MNLATLIGLLLGTALIGTAAFLSSMKSGVSILTLIDVTSILIVVGGSLAATAIAFNMKTVVRLFGLLKMIFKDDNFTLADKISNGFGNQLFLHVKCRSLTNNIINEVLVSSSFGYIIRDCLH